MVFNRSYHARRALQGQQLAIGFPRRGRPTRIRMLERCGQMRLNLQQCAAKTSRSVMHRSSVEKAEEAFEDALQTTFPVRPMTADELVAEFERLFPAP